MLGFILFMIVGIPLSMLADSKKPKTRRKRAQARQTYYAVPFAPWAAYNGNGAGTGNIASFNQT
jgi:hypothetical protein